MDYDRRECDVPVVQERRNPPMFIPNPCTTDVQYSDEEREFLMAVQAYKEKNRRPNPTWREVLHILRSLGYRKVEECGPLPVYFVRGDNKHESR